MSGLALSVYGIETGDVDGDGLLDVYLARDNQDLLDYDTTETNTSLSTPLIHRKDAALRVAAYPNPSRGAVHLAFEPGLEPGRLTVRVNDVLGRLTGMLRAGIDDVTLVPEMFDGPGVYLVMVGDVHRSRRTLLFRSH